MILCIFRARPKQHIRSREISFIMYYAKTWYEFSGPFPRQSAGNTARFEKNVAAVASR